MKELSLEEIKTVEFELLTAFDSFCKRNDIRYFLSNGTLLGAVKYKGFIPWDDDIDVLVPREDYDRMIGLFRDDNRYQLFAFEKNDKYRYPFAKLCDMTTRKEEENIDNGVDLGVDIDIFPLDVWSGDIESAEKEAIYINRNMSFLSFAKSKKSISLSTIKRFIKKIIMIFCKMLGSRYFIKNIIKASRRKKGSSSQFVGCKSWCIYGKREIIPISAFESVVDVEFEGAVFPAPIGYDVYLRSLYGNYHEDPSVEKQKTHHSFAAYRL